MGVDPTTPRSLNVKLGPRRNFHKGRAAIRHYANQTEPSDGPFWSTSEQVSVSTICLRRGLENADSDQMRAPWVTLVTRQPWFMMSPAHLLLSPAGCCWLGGVCLFTDFNGNQDISDCSPPPCACEDSWESWWWWYSCFPLAALTTNADGDKWINEFRKSLKQGGDETWDKSSPPVSRKNFASVADRWCQDKRTWRHKELFDVTLDIF